ncbi:hypothetical protein ACQPZP_43345 [Spirillospora sp. CA-142024]|uniref:hypothetical protein n=1 Tax=Spirillospora sp. CA-142024 TaxID=3240036 RepID=UPI003D8E8BA8
MPRPHHAHALPHHPAFRLAAMLAALTVAAAMLASTSPHASAARSPAGDARPRGTAPAAGVVRLLNVASASVAPPRDDPPELPKSLRLEQQFAKYTLRANGIGWRSTGRCSDRAVAACTSFEGVRWGTVKGLIDFAKESGCEITVTGGTEHGHAGGTYGHGNGYKLDIATGDCVDRMIERYPSTGVRGDGARLHRSPDGTVFAREKDHWDITFR